jgi:hypothetical protein
MPTNEGELREKFESKAQQNFFWGKCNTTKGVQKQKWCKLAREFSNDTTKKDYKKMPEKLHPEKTVKVKKSEKGCVVNVLLSFSGITLSMAKFVFVN